MTTWATGPRQKDTTTGNTVQLDTAVTLTDSASRDVFYPAPLDKAGHAVSTLDADSNARRKVVREKIRPCWSRPPGERHF